MQFSNLLNIRMRYLDCLKEDIESYGFDSKNQITQYLPKTNVLQPYLHETLANVYNQSVLSSKQNLPHKEKDFLQYKEIKKKLTEYITFKKNQSTPEKISSFDIWTKAFPNVKDEQQARSILNASDQLEDLICLADLCSIYELPEESLHLSAQIKKISEQFINYFKLIEINPLIQSKIEELFQEIDQLLKIKNYKPIIEKTNELKKLIRI